MGTRDASQKEAGDNSGGLRGRVFSLRRRQGLSGLTSRTTVMTLLAVTPCSVTLHLVSWHQGWQEGTFLLEVLAGDGVEPAGEQGVDTRASRPGRIVTNYDLKQSSRGR
eukprot:14972576-Heterocapsa_arctica.AAC.1